MGVLHAEILRAGGLGFLGGAYTSTIPSWSDIKIDDWGGSCLQYLRNS